MLCKGDSLTGKDNINHETPAIMLTFQTIDGTKKATKGFEKQCSSHLRSYLTPHEQMDCWWREESKKEMKINYSQFLWDWASWVNPCAVHEPQKGRGRRSL